MRRENHLRIAMLGHKRVPSREGGVEIVVEELSTRMVQKGHQVTCFNRRGHHVSGKEFDADELIQFKGVVLKTVFTINRSGLKAVSSSVMASLAAAFGKYDVVHFHAEGPCFMMWLPKLLGKRCIATIHGLDHQRIKWGMFAKTYIMLGERAAVKWADAIIVLSKNTQDYFQKIYNRETHFIPNGVIRPKISRADLITAQFGLQKDQYILYLGRIVPEKGLHRLVQAFKRIDTDKKLVLAGGASDTLAYMDELKALAKGDNRIIFTDFVQGQMLDELYSNAYLYTLPSDLEGMPLSLLEAMSYGNCCLVSDIPECVEVVEDKAVLFKAGNVDDLEKKLAMLCRQKEKVNKYKSKASDFICGKYVWDNVVTETLNLYR